MTAITLDHVLLVKLIDKNKGEAKAEAARPIEELLKRCQELDSGIYLSSRIQNWDGVGMSNPRDQERLLELIALYNMRTISSGFRLGEAIPDQSIIGSRGSFFGGCDVLTDHPTRCAHTQAFEAVFGPDPIERDQRAVGKNLPNWIGDYDALKWHYLAFKDAGLFVTQDKRFPCFDPTHRQQAAEQLGLLIVSPEQAVIALNNHQLSTHSESIF